MSDSQSGSDIDARLPVRDSEGGAGEAAAPAAPAAGAAAPPAADATAEPPAAGEVSVYDFSRPRRLGREQQFALDAVGRTYAAALETQLSSLLRAPAWVTLARVEPATCAAFIGTLPRPCAAYAFRAGDALGSTGALALAPGLALGLVERLFGGDGSAPAAERALTPLEQSALGGVAGRALEVFRDAWRDVVPLAPAVAAFAADPDVLQIARREEHLLVTALEVSAGASQGGLAVALPTAAFGTLLETRPAEPAAARAASAVSAGQRAAIEARLREARVTLAARLPGLRWSARQIVGFRPGQLVETGLPTAGPVELLVNGQPRFLGRLGQIRRHVGVCIEGPITGPTADACGRIQKGRPE